MGSLLPCVFPQLTSDQHLDLVYQYFLRGTSIVLSDELPGVNRSTLFAIGDMPSKDKLRELELTGFSKVPDPVFASVVAKLPSLRKLNLR